MSSGGGMGSPRGLHASPQPGSHHARFATINAAPAATSHGPSLGQQQMGQPPPSQPQPQPQPAPTPTQHARSVKRPRPVKSCTECRKRKLRCDRLLPCSQCQRSSRNCKYSAEHDSSVISDGSDAEAPMGATPGPTAGAIPVGSQDVLSRPAKRSCLPGATGGPTLSVSGASVDGYPHSLRNGESGMQYQQGVPASLEDIRMRLERLEKHVLSGSSAGTDRNSYQGPLMAAAPDTIRGLSVKSNPQRTRYFGQGSARVMFNLFREAQSYLNDHADNDTLRQTLLDLHRLHKVMQEEHRQAIIPIKVFIDSMIPVEKRMRDILPKKNVCDRLLTSYESTCESLYRVIHVPTFEQQYESFWEGTCEADSFLPQLLCVLSIGARFESKSKGMGHDRVDNIHIPTACALVRTWLDNLRGKQKVEFLTLQTEVLLLYTQRMTVPRIHESWTQLGALMRMAMTMGMHRDPSEFEDITPFWAEMRRRLWYTLLDLDTMISMACSLPCLIREGDYTCQAPRNLLDAELTQHLTELPPGRPIDQAADNQVQTYAASTLGVRMKVANLMNRLDTLRDYNEILEVGDKLERHLDDINFLFPRHGLLSDVHKSQQWRSRVVVDFHIRRPLLALYRPHALGVPDVPSQISRSYLRSSMVILRYLDELDPTMPHYNDIRDMYHFVFKPDIIQAGFSVCFHIKSAMRQNADNMSMGPSGLRMTPDSADDNSSYAGLDSYSLWSPARLISTVEKALDLLIRNAGGSDIKDIVLLSVVLYSVQAQDQDLDDVVMGLRSVLETCMLATKTSAEKLASMPIGLPTDAFGRERQPFGYQGERTEVEPWSSWGGWMTES